MTNNRSIQGQLHDNKKKQDVSVYVRAADYFSHGVVTAAGQTLASTSGAVHTTCLLRTVCTAASRPRQQLRSEIDIKEFMQIKLSKLIEMSKTIPVGSTRNHFCYLILISIWTRISILTLIVLICKTEIKWYVCKFECIIKWIYQPNTYHYDHWHKKYWARKYPFATANSLNDTHRDTSMRFGSGYCFAD